MNWNEFSEAVEDARETMRGADIAVQRLAKLLPGRLRTSGIDHATLCALKRDLADYNMQTHRWSATKGKQ